jgi:hypothetical protein
MNFKLLIIIALTSSTICQVGPIPPYVGANCATSHPATDLANEGCATCIAGNFFRTRVGQRILEKNRLLQGSKSKWSCLAVGTDCATLHTNDPTAIIHGCATCNNGFTRT